MRPTDKAKQETAYTALLDDLQRCEKLGIKLYNIHPGMLVLLLLHHAGVQRNCISSLTYSGALSGTLDDEGPKRKSQVISSLHSSSQRMAQFHWEQRTYLPLVFYGAISL